MSLFPIVTNLFAFCSQAGYLAA